MAITTKDLVFQAAEELKAANQSQTIRAVRDILGHGSNTTIHKYLIQWKKNNVQLPIENDKELEHEIEDLKQQLKQQQRQNQQLAKELLSIERKLALTEQEHKDLIIAFNKQTAEHQDIKTKFSAALELNQAIIAERDTSLAQVLDSKEKIIKTFQEDLKQINQETMVKLSEISIKNQDIWMEEKVKNKVLETTINDLKNNIAKLEQQLLQEQAKTAPLRKRIIEQDEIISKHLSIQVLNGNGVS